MKPKYSIIVQDLSADQVRTLVNELDGGDFFTSTNETPKFVPHAAASVEKPVAPAGQLQSVEITQDATGLPWDERIHSGSKGINKDGTWKKRKGVQPVEITQVEAELRGRVGQQVPVVAAPVAPLAPQAPLPPAPAAPPVPVAVAPITRDFQGLMLRISQLAAAQQLTPNYTQTIIQRVNEGFGIALNTITDVAANAQHVDYAWQCLEVDGKAN
jgi:hypothetical protein